MVFIDLKKAYTIHRERYYAKVPIVYVNCEDNKGFKIGTYTSNDTIQNSITTLYIISRTGPD